MLSNRLFIRCTHLRNAHVWAGGATVRKKYVHNRSRLKSQVQLTLLQPHSPMERGWSGKNSTYPMNYARAAFRAILGFYSRSIGASQNRSVHPSIHPSTCRTVSSRSTEIGCALYNLWYLIECVWRFRLATYNTGARCMLMVSMVTSMTSVPHPRQKR